MLLMVLSAIGRGLWDQLAFRALPPMCGVNLTVFMSREGVEEDWDSRGESNIWSRAQG